MQDLLKAIKNRDKASGDTRNHAEAMSAEEMKKMMQWSEGHVSGDPAELKFDNTEDLVAAGKHYLMRAFATSGFTLWTRYIHCSAIYIYYFLQHGTGTLSCALCNQSTSSCISPGQPLIVPASTVLIFSIEKGGRVMVMMVLCEVSFELRLM